MKKALLALFLIALTSVVNANCRRYESGLDSYTVRCNDGNEYRVQKNEILGTTRIQGNNYQEGSQWNQTITNNGITSPTMRGNDKQGNDYNCRMNTFTKQWQCY